MQDLPPFRSAHHPQPLVEGDDRPLPSAANLQQIFSWWLKIPPTAVKPLSNPPRARRREGWGRTVEAIPDKIGDFWSRLLQAGDGSMTVPLGARVLRQQGCRPLALYTAAALGSARKSISIFAGIGC